MKKLFISIMMVLALGATAALAQTSGSCGDGVTWYYRNTGSIGANYYYGILDISGNGAMDDYTSATTSPWGKAGYTVNANKLEAVVVDEGVTRIGNYAFPGDGSTYTLEEVKLPASVEAIGSNAFYNNGGLSDVVMPARLQSIGESAFEQCDLKTLVLPSSVTDIGVEAFHFNRNLQRIYVTSAQPPALGKDAFSFIASGAEVYVPAGALEAYSSDPAWGALNPLSMPVSGTGWSYADGTMTVTNANPTGWDGYRYEVTKVVIQSSVWSLPDLRSFPNIKDVRFERTTPPDGCGDLSNKFADPYSITFYVPASAYDVYKDVLSWYNVKKTTVTVEGGSCGDNLTWTIDDGVLVISGSGDMADYASDWNVPWHSYRNEIVSVRLPEGITSVAPYAFSGMGLNYSDFEVPEGCRLQSAHRSSFQGVNFPYGEVIYFGGLCYGMVFPAEQEAGVAKYGVETIVLREGTVSVMDEAFATTAIRETGKTSSYNPLEKVKYLLIPRTVTTIGDRAFYALEGLPALTVPESVAQVGDSVWGGCRNLKRLTWMPASCSLGTGVFHPKLADVEFGKSVRHIPADMFAGNTAMASVAIPHEVQTVGDRAFFRCTDLSRVALGAGVVSLGENAFSGCTDLTTIQSYAITPPEATPYCFLDVPITATVQIPCGCIPAYEAASEWEYFWSFTEIIAYNATGYSSNEEWGTVSVEQTCAEATFRAEPASGCKFLRWSDGGVENPRVIPLLADVELVAEFASETSGIASIWDDGTEVYADGNTVFIRNNDCEATVYDTTGRCLYRGYEREIAIGRSGIFIVEIGGRRQKVVM